MSKRAITKAMRPTIRLRVFWTSCLAGLSLCGASSSAMMVSNADMAVTAEDIEAEIAALQAALRDCEDAASAARVAIRTAQDLAGRVDAIRRAVGPPSCGCDGEMTRPQFAPTLVSGDDLPEYPFGVEDRLDAHWFFVWERRRWLNSDMGLSGTGIARRCSSI